MTAMTPPLGDAELAEMRAMLANIPDRDTFLAAAPESMGRLLDEVERLKRENEQFRAGMNAKSSVVKLKNFANPNTPSWLPDGLKASDD